MIKLMLPQPPRKPELKVIIGGEVPKGVRVTPAALMPKVLCCIEGKTGTVFKGGEVVKKFHHAENAMKKTNKVYKREFEKATNFLKKVTKGGDLFLKERL